MSALPSPLKSPTLTPSQLTAGLHVVQSCEVNFTPLEIATYHWPRERARPAMSVLPSPLKSPTLTSTQVTPVPQVVHSVVLKSPAPVLMPTHHWPRERTRPTMSGLLSPLKSPVCTSTQVSDGLQVAQSEFANPEPLESPTHHWPSDSARPMMSALPSPLKSATLMSTQLSDEFQVSQRVVVKLVPVDSPTHHWPLSGSKPAMS